MCVHLDYAIVPNILVIFYSIKILPRSSIQYVLQHLIMHTLFELWLQFCRIITKFWFSCVLLTKIRIKFLIRLSLDCTFLTKKHEGRMCQKILFKITQMNVKTVNYWYLIFLVTPRHNQNGLKVITRLRIKQATWSNISLTSQI